MINKVILQGRFTQDLELKTTQNSVSVISFNIAVNDNYKETKNTYFINCVAWNNNAEFIYKYFKKGDMVLIEGKLTTRKWEDNNGNNRLSTEIIVDKVHFCGSSKHEAKTDDVDLSENYNQSQPVITEQKQVQFDNSMYRYQDDDLPF